MIIEALTVITLFTQPMHFIEIKPSSPVLPVYPNFISQSLTVHLEKSWKEYKASEVIASSA